MLMVVGALLAACLKMRAGHLDQDTAETIEAIAKFHARLNAGQFGEIYESMHDAERRAWKQGDAVALMKQTHDQFGAFREATNIELNVIVGAPIEIRAVYNSKFDNGATTELFVFRREDSEPKLARYEIYPGTMTP